MVCRSRRQTGSSPAASLLRQKIGARADAPRQFKTSHWGLNQAALWVIGQVAPLRIPAATAVGARDDFEQMTVQVLEIDATATVVVIDFT